MIELSLPGMTCGGCARGVSAALKALDPDIQIETDLTSRKVRVTTTATEQAVRQAVAEAGFEPA
jgi:copper chaperone